MFKKWIVFHKKTKKLEFKDKGGFKKKKFERNTKRVKNQPKAKKNK